MPSTQHLLATANQTACLQFLLQCRIPEQLNISRGLAEMEMYIHKCTLAPESYCSYIA